ncbi:hypothetical protein NC653_000338 [Populus alba x Populus x berolinensis]|uniref:Uncharacterized protein n=1 Tax=Populus alba x Populus x berolinensis TaxID=444605 RepID=A0AAD6RIC5_9ROSI|nr:hypothetical protein NC653_000338 [Populus alba x Populus x berolinensis]
MPGCRCAGRMVPYLGLKEKMLEGGQNFAEDISGFHANTHIPIVIGAQMRYEITGDPLYKDIGTFFMDIVTSSHSYATGGTSVSEFWSDPKRLASTLQTENEESCTTYNMLKVSRHLFRWTKEMAYADYYERALTNGVLGIQRGTEPGVMIYMLPQHPGSSKGKSYHGWGTLYDTFWCCYGTGIIPPFLCFCANNLILFFVSDSKGIESFSKLGDSIYFEEEGEVPGLYIIQYISSSLDWKSGQIMINQKVDPVVSSDPYLRVTFTFSPNEGSSQASTLNLRIPVWTHLDGATATINSQSLAIPAPGSFLSVNRKWSSGDKLSLQLPISLRTEAIQDSGNSTFVLTNSNQSITMEEHPKPGTDACLQATFRIVFNDSTSSKVLGINDVIDKSVMLEPFDLPGMLLVQQGKDSSLAVTNSAADDGSSIFRVVLGLDGKDGTVSLESGSQEGCYIYSGVNYKSGQSMKLSCKLGSSDPGFNQGARFVMNKGLSEYHPISFVAEGDKKNFLLAPLHKTDSNLNLQVAKHDHPVFCLVAGLDSRTLYP